MRRAALAAVAILLAGCGFSNAMYNARRHVGDAERAARRGDDLAARTAWVSAIDRAAASFRREPDGAHAAEALYLVGRARYGLGEPAAARAALERSIALTDDVQLRAAARAYLGAADLAVGDPVAAQASLDAALADLSSDGLTAWARLWRARARWANGHADVWDDLDRAADADGFVAREARMQMARIAVEQGDEARAAAALRALLDDADAPRPDSVAALAFAAADRWGPAHARAMVDFADAAWPAASRDTMLLVHADLLAMEGDTAAAVRVALDAADRLGTAPADAARLRAARWQLRAIDDVGGLEDVRAMLLPAVASPDVQRLLESLRVLDAMLDAGGEDRPLALFAAAELARDDLDAPALARDLFLTYSERASDEIWAPKAVLAAAALGPHDDAIRMALARVKGSLYAEALNGGVDAAAYADAEERLAHELADVRGNAIVAAGGRDPTVGRAVARIDSLRTSERLDSMRVHCALLIDSIAIRGIRADSVRAACIREDSARVTEVLGMDTLALRDTAAAGPTRGRRRPVIDTLRVPRP